MGSLRRYMWFFSAAFFFCSATALGDGAVDICAGHGAATSRIADSCRVSGRVTGLGKFLAAEACKAHLSSLLAPESGLDMFDFTLEGVPEEVCSGASFPVIVRVRNTSKECTILDLETGSSTLPFGTPDQDLDIEVRDRSGNNGMPVVGFLRKAPSFVRLAVLPRSEVVLQGTAQARGLVGPRPKRPKRSKGADFDLDPWPLAPGEYQLHVYTAFVKGRGGPSRDRAHLVAPLRVVRTSRCKASTR